MVLTIKSKVLKMEDFRNISVDEMIPVYTVDEQVLEKDINRILKSNGTKTEEDQVRMDDLVTISCKSDMEKFNKNKLSVIIGKNLYSKELEEQLIGKEKNGTYRILMGDTPVEVTIEKIVRTCIPALTDENVKAFGNSDYQTVKELRKFCIDKQLDRYLDDCEELDQAAAYVWKVYGEKRQVELDETEREQALKKAKYKLEELQNNLESEAQEEDTGLTADSQENAEMDMESFMQDICLMEVKLAAYGYEIARKENRLLTDEDYQSYIDKWKPYYEGLSEEEIRKKHKKEDYVISRYAEIICDQIDEYVKDEFKRKMNPLSE